MDKRRIAVITPVDHLQGIEELLKTKGKRVSFIDGTNKEHVRKKLLGKKKPYNTLVCNPNQQPFVIDKKLLEGTGIELINTISTGMNHIDLDYCKENNIAVWSLKEDSDLLEHLPSTSELAFGLMMSLVRKIPEGRGDVMTYNWDYTPYVGRQIRGLRVGIVGMGRLGRMMSRFCEAFGTETYFYDPYQAEDLSKWDLYAKKTDTLEELFEECDVVSIHCHVTEETKGIINSDILKHGKGTYLINTARGEIVDEWDVLWALNEGHLEGYGADVLVHEFDYLLDSPIIAAMRHPNKGHKIIVTPHVGGMTIEGQTAAYKYAINKL